MPTSQVCRWLVWDNYKLGGVGGGVGVGDGRQTWRVRRRQTMKGLIHQASERLVGLGKPLKS